jgi:mono/diheme cytochrome c family protein
MKNLFAVSLVVVVFALVFATYAPAQTGGDLYKAKCAACHGPDGKGDTAMGKNLKLRDLGSADVQGQSDADLNTIITKGKNKMPAYDGKLTKEQIDSLVKHIRSLKK